MKETFETNWMSTVEKNIDEVERLTTEYIGRKYSVGLSCGTTALHMCVKLAREKLYGQPQIGHGVLEGKKVFCADMRFSATVNSVVYEGGIPVFIDTEREIWNMDPKALEKAFDIHPEVKLIVIAHLYGTPGKVDEIKAIAKKHDALIIEDAAESFGSMYKGIQTGMFGDYSAISFKLIKFRSMTCEKNSKGKLLLDERRLTNYEKKLISTSLDELPELFNIPSKWEK